MKALLAPEVEAPRPRRWSPPSLWSPRRRRASRDLLTAYAFIAPFILFYVILKLWPIIFGFWVSLHRRGAFGDATFIGLQNYTRVGSDPQFWEAIANTALFTALATPALIGLGMLLALILDGPIRDQRGVFRALFYLPNVLSVSVIGLIFTVVLRADDAGLVNNVLSNVGLGPIVFLLDATAAMPSIAMVAVWWTVGFNMLILLAGLQNIPDDVNDAARVDGASGRQHFWYVTLPLLRRPLMFVTILQIIFCFQLFGLVDIMTKGGPGGRTRSIVYYIFERAFIHNQLGYGSAIAFLMFMLLFVLSLVQLRLFRREEDAI